MACFPYGEEGGLGAQASEGDFLGGQKWRVVGVKGSGPGSKVPEGNWRELRTRGEQVWRWGWAGSPAGPARAARAPRLHTEQAGEDARRSDSPSGRLSQGGTFPLDGRGMLSNSRQVGEATLSQFVSCEGDFVGTQPARAWGPGS